jgi:hypothetical protein
MATWWTATRKEEVWERWKAGQSAAEIARALGKWFRLYTHGAQSHWRYRSAPSVQVESRIESLRA